VIQLDIRHVDKQGGESFTRRFGGLGLPLWLTEGDAVFYDPSYTRSVCVEIKAPLDLAVCVETTGRLVQQARAARNAGHSLYVVIVHGIINVDDDGYLVQFKYGKWIPVLLPGFEPRPILYRRVENALNSLSILDGVLVKRAADDREVAAQILALYHWWQKDLADHTTTMQDQFYSPIAFGGLGGITEIPLVRRVAKELAGIGIEKSKAVSERFGSVYEMAVAEPEEWEKVKGIGKKGAERIVRDIRGGRGE
jgi:ERCC4-type nuclease